MTEYLDANAELDMKCKLCDEYVAHTDMTSDETWKRLCIHIWLVHPEVRDMTTHFDSKKD